MKGYAIIGGVKTEVDGVLEHVAGIIADWPADWDIEEQAAEINCGDGWTIDCYLPGGEYITAQNFTRLQGVHLSDAELAQALAMAREFQGLSSAAAALGRRGGSSTSERKQAASRENGRKGGRPRKQPTD